MSSELSMVEIDGERIEETLANAGRADAVRVKEILAKALELKAAGIGTYQLFQETYRRDTYARMHLVGKKRDFDWRPAGMDRAMAGGIDDVGVGILFGLYDRRFELLGLMHIRHLEERFGVGPHTSCPAGRAIPLRWLLPRTHRPDPSQTSVPPLMGILDRGSLTDRVCPRQSGSV